MARLGPFRQEITTFCTVRISIARCFQKQVQVDPAGQECVVPDGSRRFEWIWIGSSLKFAFSSGELLPLI